MIASDVSPWITFIAASCPAKLLNQILINFAQGIGIFAENFAGCLMASIWKSAQINLIYPMTFLFCHLLAKNSILPIVNKDYTINIWIVFNCMMTEKQ